MGFVRRLTGKDAAKASIEGAEIQAQAGADASALLDPFQQIGQQGIEGAGFLTDPQAQFDFLQNNPLFQAAQQQGQQVAAQGQEDLFKMAAARGRLSSGDTIQEIQNLGDISSRNLLLQSAPLIQDQKQSIGDLLNLGVNTASNQGNLLLGQGASIAGGITGAANARAAGAQNILGIGAAAAGSPLGQAATTGLTSLLSDPRLKTNITKTGTKNGFNLYSWDWNEEAKGMGLSGSSAGVMADEVKATNPEAITMDRGYMRVNYKMIGVH